MSVKEDICKGTGAPNDEAPNDEDNNDMDNIECTSNQNKNSNDNKDNNDKKDNKYNKNKVLKVNGIPVNPLLTLDYTLSDEHLPATAENPAFLSFIDNLLKEIPPIIINKTTGETYRTCVPFKNCKTGIIAVRHEYDDPTDRPPARPPTISVAPPGKKRVVKKQTRNPFKKFKRM